ncbi:MAM and LDL-receptor class A domain-containing protein 1-like, partial [Ruditapes philippinarum]|uniref:MAM and LDL-receptor class A domain-containing protein 1-like n=1 Tax=Ruditapes philippinarum TaxID=129788 RepID=UPI00295B957F
MSLFVRCLIVVWFCVCSCECSRVKRGFCSTRNLNITNGDYRLRAGSSVVDYTCNSGYHMYGMDRAVCFGSKWSSDPPICIASTCQTISPTNTLKITQWFGGALLKFTCAAMYQLKGEKTLTCDGSEWSAPTPLCIPWKPPVSCDFEDPELCGWSHHEKNDQDWRWNTGKTSTSRTGPSHDHTLGAGGDGHYMYFETSSPTRFHHKAILQSPLYPASYSKQTCFTFWYHILGESDIGDFEVFVKPERAQNLSSLNASFHTNEDRGDVWYKELIRVKEQSETFQILMVATRGTGLRSDFAFDDVSLARCA